MILFIEGVEVVDRISLRKVMNYLPSFGSSK